MTHQPITPETQETNAPERRRPRLRRGIRKRGILPSFGDIVLPVVSVAAVGLLVLAGRQFFISGLQTPPDISSTKAYADSPALIAEREAELERERAQTVAELPKVEVEEVHEEISQPDENLVAAADMPPVITQPVKASAPAPKKAAPAKAPAKASTPAKTTTAAKASAPATTPAKTAAVANPWRVQIGAYGSKAAAQDAANKLKKAGYKTTVYSNPASKHVKVWVDGGATKASAEKVVEAMKKLGYKSSFCFPPAK